MTRPTSLAVESQAHQIAASQDANAVGFVSPVLAWSILVWFAKIITAADGVCNSSYAKQVLQASATNGLVGDNLVTAHIPHMRAAHHSAFRRANRPVKRGGDHDLAAQLNAPLTMAQYEYLTRHALQSTLDSDDETVAAVFESASQVEDEGGDE